MRKAKRLYDSKGTCFNCHGTDRGGNGPAAEKLNPAPRNFRHHEFCRHRTEGEIFWVIKHGSPSTAMIGFVSVLSDKEIWSLIQYERTFAGKHGRQGMGRREGMGAMMGSGGGSITDGEAEWVSAPRDRITLVGSRKE